MKPIFKVNGAIKPSLLRLLPSEVWVGCRYSRIAGQSGTVDAERFRNLRADYPSATFILSFDESDTTHEERLQVLEQCAPDYYEYLPPDRLKKPEFAAYMERLDEIQLPKIAGTFPILKEDLSMIRDREPFAEMMRRGTAYFQFEIESAVNPGYRLSSAQLRKVDGFLAEFPVLVSDSFERLDRYPLKNQCGYALDVIVPDADRSQRSWNAISSGQVVRLLKTLV